MSGEAARVRAIRMVGGVLDIIAGLATFAAKPVPLEKSQGAAAEIVDAIIAATLDVARAEAQGRAAVALELPMRRRDAIGNWYEVSRAGSSRLLLSAFGSPGDTGWARCLDPVRARELAAALHAWASEAEAGR